MADPSKATPLSVLLVEDSEDDAELILRELRRGGFSPRWVRVDTSESMRAALDQEERWDVVIADYRMPGFSGLAALRLLKERDLDVPFILASGVIGEDVAVEAMRAGADDYVMKRNLARLMPAIARELREAEMRRDRRRAREALERQLLFTRALSGSIGEGVCAIDPGGRLTFANPAAQRMLGASEAELIGRDLRELVHPRHEAERVLDVIRSRSSYHSDDDQVQRKDGRLTPVSLTASPLTDGSIEGAVLAFQDITDHKRQIEAGHFLAWASEGLAEQLDYERTLVRAASLCVPGIADACALVIGGEPHAFAHVAAGITDGQPSVRYRRADAAVERYLAPAAPLEEQARERPELLDLVAGSQALRVELEERGPFAAACAALRGGGASALGSLILLTGRARPPPDGPLARELADRIAMAIVNARLYHDAQQAIRARDEFLSIASHELRTPLTPLRLQLHDLVVRARARELASQPPERLTARLESASRQVDRLTGLVSNLLDVTRIVGGRVKLEPEQFDLVALVREVLERAEPEAQRGHYRVQLDGEGAIVGRWDRLRIDQVVTNLMSNALKYGQGHPIDVRVWREGDLALVQVRDRGIGISAEHLERIFHRFERAVSERAFGGLGLGLYIVRRLVEAHGGSVRVESEPGQGAAFTVELPIGPPASSA
jgi:PAS domain S-box-containing protein